MSKNKRKHIPSSINTAPAPRTTGRNVVTGDSYPTEEIKWWREAIEGLVIAIVLALLIRGFEAEAFVIPTGSMAPTLRGFHKDILCPSCGYEYAAGASEETVRQEGAIVGATCPLCRFPKKIEYTAGRDASFDGDRILVNKFAYDILGEPERFDVIVFKNPNDAKQNYIKRLIGLPGETIAILRGDIYFNKTDSGNDVFTIARKPPGKIKALLQRIHDTKYVSQALDAAGVPPRWQPNPDSAEWTSNDKNHSFSLQAADKESWLRYRHITPTTQEWLDIQAEGGAAQFEGGRGQLIDDFYAYNTQLGEKVVAGMWNPSRFQNRSVGKNWVGDLAVECDVDIQSNTGELYLDLVEGGWHFRCTIDVATGKATLKINDGANSFVDGPSIEASTDVTGTGKHNLMFSNVDDELRLWVDGSVVEFNHPGHFIRPNPQMLRPVYNGEEDPGDLAPIGVGGRNLAAQVRRLQVYRDKYYISVDKFQQETTMGDHRELDHERATTLFRTPEQWATDPLLRTAPQVKFVLRDFDDDGLDQFFPMGDNSPQSLDARIWWNSNDHERGNYVERQFLIGEAVVIYYPHPWHVKVPGEQWNTKRLLVWPKFSRMGLIR